MYLTTVSSVGAVWVVHAYINENNTHRSETKITEKCFKTWKPLFSFTYGCSVSSLVKIGPVLLVKKVFKFAIL